MIQLFFLKKVTFSMIILFVLMITNLDAKTYLVIDDSTYTIYDEPLIEYYRPFWGTEDSLLSQSYMIAIGLDRYSTWEIKNDSLRLLRIEQVIILPSKKYDCGYETGSRIIPADSIFQDKDYPVFADWYSGTVLLPTGRRLPDEHMGHNRYFEAEIHIVIKNGCVIDRVNINNQGLDMYRSGEDIDWCGLEAVKMNCEYWIDGRLLSQSIMDEIVDTTMVFKTRGIAICGKEYEGSVLAIPATPMTEEVILWMDSFIVCTDIIDSAFVEIEANLCNKDDDYIQIKVINSRMMDSNESIHSPLYPIHHRILKLN